MADWYVSSAAYATYTAFQTSHVYTLGALIVPTAPALKAKWVFRCTTAGTSTTEPAWATTNNATSTSGTAVFTNVTGQSTFFWTAAAGDLATICTTGNRLSGGDRVFISSDHSETQTATTNYGAGSNGPSGFSTIQFICVNRAGSTPPVAADVTTGASVTCTGTMNFMQDSPCFYDGITFTAGASGAFAMGFNITASVQHLQYFLNCALVLSNGGSSPSILANNSGVHSRAVLDNTTTSYAAAGQKFAGASVYALDLTWINTPISGALAGTMPTSLIQGTGGGGQLLTLRGIDLSSTTGTLVKAATGGGTVMKVLFDSCKIASAVTRYNATGATGDAEEVELLNCFDGTNIINERYTVAGTLTTERTITLSGGATDNVGTFSHKIVTTANIDKFASTMNTFWLDVNYTTTGNPKTATVEIISSAALNNDEISLWLEYEGTSSSSLASWANNFIATPLTVASAVTTSTATWNSSPATPAKQKLQVAFTPQTAGPVRGVVRIGKASTTVYVNPQITVT